MRINLVKNTLSMHRLVCTGTVNSQDVVVTAVQHFTLPRLVFDDFCLL